MTSITLTLDPELVHKLAEADLLHPEALKAWLEKHLPAPSTRQTHLMTLQKLQERGLLVDLAPLPVGIEALPEPELIALSQTFSTPEGVGAWLDLDRAEM